MPPAPTAGTVHVNAGPASCVPETNVVPGGSGSDMANVCASLGPALATVIVKSRFVPATTVGGAVLVTDTSADEAIVVDDVALLLAGLGSAVVELTVAVLVPTPPLTALGGTLIVSENVAESPAASVAIEQSTVPPAPTAGTVHVNAGPASCVPETNVVPAGSGSDMATSAAGSGPALATVIE